MLRELGKLTGIISGLLPLLIANNAIAQDEDLEMQMFFAPAETVTSAARHTQPLAHSPSAVTVLTREDIEAAGARTLPEVLRLVPNMDIAMVKPFWYAVGVRGGTTEASDTLLLLVDGRDVTFELLGAPMWTVQHFSMDDVERIEIIRGPGSALYGANAFSGVVHVITRTPGEGPTASTSIRGGEHGQLELSGRGTASFGPLALSIGVGWEQEDLWTGRDLSGREVIRGRLRGKIDLGSQGRLLLETGAYLSQGRLHVDIGEMDVNNITNVYAQARYEFEELIIQTVYDRAYFDLDIGLNLYYPDLDLDLAEAPPIDGVVDKVGVLSQYTLKFFHNRLTFGAEYVFNGYHSDTFVEPDHYEHRIGVFFQDEFDISSLINDNTDSAIPPLIITAGLRYDRNSITRYELSPRAAVIFAPTDDHSLRFGYAHAFLKPTFFESSLHIKLIDVSGLNLTSLDVATPDLDNQTIDSIELGYAGSFFNDHLSLKLDFAYNWYRNNIGFSLNPANMEYIVIGGVRIPNINGSGFGFTNNRAGEDGHNVDLQIVVRPTEHTRLLFNAGYRQVFKNKNGDFAGSNPIWRFVTGGDWSTPFGLTASIRAFFSTSYYRSVGHPDSILVPMVRLKLPAYCLLNARIAYKISILPFEGSAGVEGFNLLGARFRELGGFFFPNAPDFAGERLGRRIVFFLQGTI
ncbi:MAG: TonB-dependent receptor [Deltaproteobacteria bacterium]|nr:TonB-dependent receptor [Deltaproteobacteria bacterium]